MLLRRVMEHVKAQNWTAVALDFFIVVVGVFIGIQVANLNDARQTREIADDFAERLVADLSFEAWQYVYLVEYYDDVLANADRTLAFLNGERDGGDEELLISAYRATQFTQDDHRRATFDEITATGAIGLIRDPELRNTAMNVYSATIFSAIYDSISVTPYRNLFRSEVPAAVQDALLAECGDKFVEVHNYSSIVDTLDYPCESGLKAESIRGSVEALRQNEDFLRTLRLHRSNLKTQIDLLTRWYPDVRDDLEKFRKEEG